jgi:membrane-bound serine protease (ClpP class)
VLLALAIAGLFVLPDPWRVIALGAAAVIEVGEVFLWIRFLERYRVTTGAEGLVGARVEVIEACDPEGRARVMGELWKARAESPIAVGEAARVVAVEGLTLVLEPPGDANGG